MTRNGVSRAPLLLGLALALAVLAVVKALNLAAFGAFSLGSVVVPAQAQDAPGRLRESKINPAPEQTDADSFQSGEPEEVVIDGSVAEGKQLNVDPNSQIISESERTVLESLRTRREELATLERELSLRENLIKAAEQRIDDKITELKTIESRIEQSFKKKEDEDDARLAGLVKIYEGMKPKAAAQIFDRLDIDVMIGVAKRMKPQAMGAVLARMDPAVAERLTIAMVAMEPRQPVEAPTPELEAVDPQ